LILALYIMSSSWFLLAKALEIDSKLKSFRWEAVEDEMISHKPPENL
jgi:hypothetical protein